MTPAIVRGVAVGVQNLISEMNELGATVAVTTSRESAAVDLMIFADEATTAVCLDIVVAYSIRAGMQKES